jgi:predicted nucleic acid-binding protein
MIVVADTSPLRYLILIDEVDLLPRIFGEVVISDAVLSELMHENSPEALTSFVSDRPEWIKLEHLDKPIEIGLSAYLDIGESESIQLAEQLNAELLLIDERKGRMIAKQRGLNIIGTFGVLLQAQQRNLVDLETALEKLEKEDFYLSAKLKDQFREK